MDVVFPCAMRAAPTIAGTGTGHYDSNPDSSIFNLSTMTIDEVPTGIISSIGLQSAGISSMTTGHAGGLRVSSDSTLGFSAEL